MPKITLRVPALALAAVLFGAPPVVAAEVVDRLAAIVNDDVILLSELRDMREQVRREAALSEFDTPMPDDRELLQRLIEEKLVEQEAARLHIEVTEKEIEKAIADVLQANRLTLDDLKMSLAQQGVSYEEYRQRISDQIQRLKLTSRTVSSRVSVDDNKMQAYYSANREDFVEPERVHLRRIFFPHAEDYDAMAEARRVRKLASDRPFADLVTAVTDAGGDIADMGELSLVDLRRDYVQRVHKLAEGAWTEPFSTGEGVHLLQVAERVPERYRSFDEVKPEIEQRLSREEAERQFTEWVRELRENSHVRIML